LRPVWAGRRIKVEFKKDKSETHSIKGISLGKLMSIRNGLGYAVQAGIITPVQRDVYDEIGHYLTDIGWHIPDVKRDPRKFLKDSMGISEGMLVSDELEGKTS
jgi:hypothetical protein